MFDKASARKCIKIPSLEKFSHLTTDEQRALQEVIIKIKMEQICELVRDLPPVLELLITDDNSELTKKILSLATLSSLSYEDLIKTALVKYEKKEEDVTLKSALNTPLEKSFFEPLQSFLHQYFLDKPHVIKNHPLAFTERVSERLLHKGHKHISMYLNGGCKALSVEEKKLLAKAYPLSAEQNEVLKKANLQLKTFRREAHLDIALSLEELQSIAASLIDNLLSPTFSENLVINELNAQGKKQHELYTKKNSLHLIAQGKLKEFQDYLNQYFFSITDMDYHSGMSFLAYAVKANQLEIVTWLLSMGAKVNQLNQEGYSPLHFAAELPNPAVLCQLLKTKPHINIGDRGGYSPLYVAAELGNVHNVQALLEVGADPNLQNNRYGNTPFHAAVRRSEIEVIKVFIACERVKADLRDKYRNTVFDLAKEIKNPEVVQLLEAYEIKIKANRVLPLMPTPLGALKPAALAITKAPPANSTWTQALKLGPLFANAKEQSQILSRINFSQHTSHLMPSYRPGNQAPGNSSLKDLFKNELNSLIELEKKFDNIVGTLQTLANAKATFAQTYKNVYELLQTVVKEGLSTLRFAEELCRFGFIKHLEELQDNKTVLQIAIEGEELDVIEAELSKNPNQEALLNYKGKEVTILQYAITLGKPEAVNTFIKAAEKNNAVKLGDMPSNAMEQAHDNQFERQKAIRAYKEADDFFDINIPAASKVNTLRVLRDLRKTVSNPKLAINYLFDPQEYNLIRFLLNDKKDEQPKHLLWKKFKTWIYRRRLEKRLAELNLQKPEDKEEINRLKIAVDYLTEQLTQGIRKRYTSLALPDLPKITNIYRHATKYIPLIKESGKLLTVREVLDNSKVASVSTERNSLSNVFFSPPGSDLTPFRSTASGVVELDMAVAIENKLLEEHEFYTSWHLSANRIGKVEESIVFKGVNPNTKTIYRVHHTKKSKVYTFEYYQDGEFVGHKKLEHMLPDEFFVGNNMRMFALRMVLLLRYIKGPLKNSYTDYFYQNCYDPKIIKALRGAIFGVVHVEGKSTKPIDINNEAVKIVDNEPIKEISPVVSALLQNLIEKNELAVFVNELKTLKNEQLETAVTIAVTHGRVEFLQLLMQRGVRVSFNNNEPLRELINKLQEDYIKAGFQENDPKVQMGLKMLSILLYEGSSSIDDPNHICYSATGDNFSAPIRGNWSDSSQQDLMQLAKFIFRFKQLDLQKLLINSVSKHLEDLYKITATYGYYELHGYIANRLGKAKLFETQPHNKLITFVNEENVTELTDFLTSKSSIELIEYYYLLTFAIINGKEKVIAAIFSFFRGWDLQSFNSSFLLALQHQQTTIARQLSRLGANTERPNIIGETPLDFNADNIAAILPDDYFENIKDIPGTITSCVIRKQNSFLLKLCAKFKLLPIKHSTPNNSLLFSSKNHFMPLITALEYNNTEAFEILLKHYDSAIQDNQTRRKFFDDILIHTNKLNKIDILNLIFKYIKEDPQKLHLLLFFPIDKIIHLCRYSITFVLEETFIAFLKGIKQFFKKKNIFETSDHDGANFLQVGASYNLEFIVKAILDVAPNLKFVSDSISLVFFCEKFLFYRADSKDDGNFLKLLFEKGLPKPDPAEQILMLKHALLHKKVNQIRWLFENKIINKDYLSENLENILQLAIKSYLENSPSFINLTPYNLNNANYPIDSPRDNLPDEFLDYLFNELGIKADHIDRMGRTLLHYDPAGCCHFARNFKEYIVTKTDVNLITLDQNKNSILHTRLREEPYLQAMAKYLAQKGDMKIVNNEGFSIVESQLAHHTSQTILSKFTEQGLSGRNCIFLPNLEAQILTCELDGTLYIAMHKEYKIFLEEQDAPGHYSFTVKGQTAPFISLSHAHRGMVKALPTIFHRKKPNEDYEWVKAENIVALENASNEKERAGYIGLNLICCMLKFLLTLERFPAAPELKHATHKLPEADYQKLLTAGNEVLLFLQEAYSSLLSGKLPTAKEVLLLKVIVSTKLRISVLKNEGLSYTVCEEISSPAELAITTGQPVLLQELLTAKYDALSVDKYKHCFTSAVIKQDLVSLEILIDRQPVPANFIFSLIKNQLRDMKMDMLQCLVKKISNAKGYNLDLKKKLHTLIAPVLQKEGLEMLLKNVEVPVPKKREGDQPLSKAKKSKLPIRAKEEKKDDFPPSGDSNSSDSLEKKEKELTTAAILNKRASSVFSNEAKETNQTKKHSAKRIKKDEKKENPEAKSSDPNQSIASPKESQSEQAPLPIEKKDANRNSFFVTLKRSKPNNSIESVKKIPRHEKEDSVDQQPSP